MDKQAFGFRLLRFELTLLLERSSDFFILRPFRRLRKDRKLILEVLGKLLHPLLSDPRFLHSLIS